LIEIFDSSVPKLRRKCFDLLVIIVLLYGGRKNKEIEVVGRGKGEREKGEDCQNSSSFYLMY